MFRQPDLAATLRKLVEAEAAALKAGKNRKQAIYAAYDRFYKGDIAAELVRSVKEQGGLFTMDDLAKWQVHIEEPVSTTYRGIAVYKLTTWVQGPAMLQALNILENMDLKAMGYNSARYLHAIYQAMNLAFADRDFYYGDPYVPPAEPIKGLLSKAYAKERFKQINWAKNDPDIGPGDPYPFQGEKNPFRTLLEHWRATAGGATTAGAPAAGTGTSATGATASAAPAPAVIAAADPTSLPLDDEFVRHFYAGTTSIEAADDKGWVVSVTPSGGWVPAVIAGKTGVGLSQRMQSFVLDPAENPFNVVEPGKHPRATLTPTLALKDGKPYLSFAVQGGDSQDQNLLQFFLERRRVRDERPGGVRGRQHQQLPDAQLVRRPRRAAGQDADQRAAAGLGARRARQDGLQLRGQAAHVRPDQRDLRRPRARHAVGRVQRRRRRLRHRLVAMP